MTIAAFARKQGCAIAAVVIEAPTPVVVRAAGYFVAPARVRPVSMPFPRVLLGGTIAIVVLSYRFYRPFDAWWYLRFLLPMWPAMMLLTAAAIEVMAQRMTLRAGRLACV